MNQETFVCDTCGERHEGRPTDFGFRLPDEVHALSYLDRYSRSRHNTDLCTLDESRYFVRCVLHVPLLERPEEFGWGVWVEVSAADHDNYLEHFHDAAENAPRFRGALAFRPGAAQRGQCPEGRSCPRRAGEGGTRCCYGWNFTTSGTISSATMLMILISGLIAGPAVSL
jgi:hypothetical protein